MIRYAETSPSPPLRSLVRRFWILEQDGEDLAVQRVVPDGCAELILNWRQPFESLQGREWQRQPRCFLAGQIEGPLLLRPRGPAKMLGIGFHPHGAAAFFRQPIHELSGRFAPLDNLSTTLARDFERALESDDPIPAIEKALLAAAVPPDLLVGEAVRRIGLARGTPDLARLARNLGVSTRQFERRFLSVVGLTAKFYCRIERFNQVYRAFGRSSWVQTALDCGYYDQAHLIRDSRRLAGTTPAMLFSEEADLAKHFYRRFGMSHSSKTACRA